VLAACFWMTNYGRVMKILQDMGPAKLLDHETDAIREAADTLLFTEDHTATREALAEAQVLARGLVESGRWIEETADALVGDLEACGPAATLA
jgi:hypothetical protein